MATSALSNRIAEDIMHMISIGELIPDTHVSTQRLADRFQVSRTPVRDALGLLAERGVLEQRENRGYFVGKRKVRLAKKAETIESNDVPPGYYELAEDWLRDEVPSEITGLFLRERYGLTKAQEFDLLNRASQEGWIERKPGYGWRLLPVAKTPEAVEQIYSFRAVIESASLMEKTFEPDRKVISDLRDKQQKLLDGDIERLPAIRLMMAGVEFHEEVIKFSRNPFFLQALERVNRLRRLIDYRSMIDRKRYYSQCSEHIGILDLIERGENIEAAHLMRRHLGKVLDWKSPYLGKFKGMK